MAISASAFWEVRTAGNDTNGGGFVSGASGTDFSQQDSKNTGASNKSVTDAVAVGTGVITSATASFTAAMVGNIVYLQGGTGTLTAVWRQVTVFTSATSITVDANVASGTGITLNIGGALLSPALACASITSGNRIYVKSGTYTMTTVSTNVANGCLNPGAVVLIQGYGTARDDFGTQPLFQASGISTFTIMQSGSACVFQNIIVDGASLTSSRGISSTAAGAHLYKCTAKNCTNNGFVTNSSQTPCVLCYATGCSTQPAFAVLNAFGCVAAANTITGFSMTNGSYVYCLSYSNTGASSDGFTSGGIMSIISNCVAYGNGRDGFRPTTSSGSTYINCIAEANTGFGFNANSLTIHLVNCATYNNTAGATNLLAGFITTNLGFITNTTGTFFVNAASGNFALNNITNQGALARAAGIPGATLDGTSTGFLDLGPIQHQDPAFSPAIGGGIIG